MRAPLRPAVPLALLLPGCVVGPDYEAPELAAPDAWHREVEADLDGARLEAWWSLLQDPHLEDLIVRAGRDNLDLRRAFERVVEAMARRGVAVSNRWPQIEGVGGASTNRASERTQPALLGRQFEAYQLGFDGSWEVDAFGRITRLIENANANLGAELEAYRDVMVVLYAEVGIEYVELRTLRERLRLTEENIRLQESTLKLTQDRLSAGIVSDLDVRQAELNLARTRATAPTLRAAIARSRFRLAVLTGQQPGQEDLGLAALPDAPVELPDRALLTSPVDALRRRPDVRAAERRLAAEIAAVGVAEADLYPRFALLGSFGFDGLDGNLSDTFAADSMSWTFGPAFRWNLLNGDRVRSNVDAQVARADQALTAYQQTVLLALEEVEASLAAYSEESARLADLEASVEAARKSVELVDSLYRAGSVDFQNVLDTQRALAAQQDAAATSRGLILQNLIRLFRALGGGWTEPETEAPPARAGS